MRGNEGSFFGVIGQRREAGSTLLLPYILLALNFALLGSCQAQDTCQNELTSWTVTETTMYKMMNCSEVLNLNINFGSLTNNYTDIVFYALKYVYGSITVQFKKDAQLSGTLSFPSLEEVSGRMLFYTNDETAYLGFLNLPNLKSVYGSSLYVYTNNAGVIGGVNIDSGNSSAPLYVGGTMLFQTSSLSNETTNRIGPVTINNFGSGNKFQVYAYGGPIESVSINKDTPDANLTLTSQFYVYNHAKTTGKIGNVEVYGLVTSTSVTFDNRFGSIGNITIIGAKQGMNIIGTIYLLTRKYTGNLILNDTCFIGNTVIENLVSAGSLSLEAQAGPIGDFSVNANSPGLMLEVNAGYVSAYTQPFTPYNKIGNFFVRGLTLARGSIRALANAGSIGNFQINLPTDPCPCLYVDGNVVAKTYLDNGTVGHFSVYGLCRVLNNIFAAVNTGSIASFTVNPGSCNSGIDVTSDVYIQSYAPEGDFMGPFRVTGLRNIYGNVNIYPQSVPFTSPIVIAGSPQIPMAVSQYVRLDTANKPYVTTVSELLIQHISSALHVYIYCDISYLGNITISGADTGFTIYNILYLASGVPTLANNAYSLRHLSITNLVGVEGGFQFYPNQGHYGNVSILGLPSSGFSIKYVLLRGSTSTTPSGLVESLVLDGVKSIYVYINAVPYNTKYGNVQIRGRNFPVGGYIYVSHTSAGAYFDRLAIDGVTSVASYIKVENNLAEPGGLISINTDNSLSNTSAMEVASYVYIKSNVAVEIANIQGVGDYLIVETATGYAQLPVVINGTAIPGLDVFNYVRVSSSSAQNRSVTFNNLRIIRGGASLLSNDLKFFSVYRTKTSYNIGPVYVNNVDVVAKPPYNGAYFYNNANSKGNDAGCVNLCNGRGSGSNSTSASCGLPCHCWAYNEGTNCEIERVCDFAPTCDCVCGSGWSSWQYVSTNSSYRIRSCDTTNTSLTCATTQLQGSVDCLEGVEYQIAAPTATTHRVCETISPECDVDFYESKSPTVTSDRECTEVTECLYGQYEAAVPTATSDRKCKNWKTCLAGEYRVALGTFTSDTICATCSDCGGGLVTAACTATSDTQCRDCSTCDLVSNYIEFPCSPIISQDVICTPCTICDNLVEYQSEPCLEDSDRVCTNYTICDPELQFQKTPGTPTTDRLCLDLLLCSLDPNSEWESRGPTPTTDRVCMPTSFCSSLEYQTLAPTWTSDRVCVPLTPYDPDIEYITTLNTATTDRVVVLATVCNSAYQFISTPSTLTSDRICSNATNCAFPDFYQVTPLTLTADRVCNASSFCDANQIEYSPPTATSDRKCVPAQDCIANQFESVPPTATTQRVCQSLRSCNNSFEFEFLPPTFTTDRICTNYTLCNYSSEYESVVRSPSSDLVCSPTTQCDFASEYEASPPDFTTDRVCGGITVCDAFAEYMYTDNTPTTDRVCFPLTDCGPVGLFQFETQQETPTTDRTCSDLTMCDSQDEFETKAATLTTDRTCVAATKCLVDEYQNKSITATSDRQCKQVKVCGAGVQYEFKPPTPTTDRSCVAIKTCIDSLQYEAIAPTATTDRKCLSYSSCKYYQKESGIPTPTSDRECINDYCAKLNPCQDRGACDLLGSNSYVCDCYPPFYGKSCSLIWSFCSFNPPIEDICQNGGLCYKNGTNPYCNCTAEYTGYNCTTSTASSSSPSSTFVNSSSFPIIVAVASVALLVLLIAALLYKRAEQRRKTSQPVHHRVSLSATFENPIFDDHGKIFKDSHRRVSDLGDEEFYDTTLSTYDFAQNNNGGPGQEVSNYDMPDNATYKSTRLSDAGVASYDFPDDRPQPADQSQMSYNSDYPQAYDFPDTAPITQSKDGYLMVDQ